MTATNVSPGPAAGSPGPGESKPTVSAVCEVGAHSICAGDTGCQCACHHVTLSGPPLIWPYVLALVALATAGPAALVLSLT